MGYATLTDAASYGFRAEQYGLNITAAQIQSGLDSASAWADTRLRGRYSMPLLAPFDPALVEAVVHIARRRILAVRGFDESTAAGREVVATYDLAAKLLDDVRNQAAHLAVTESPAPTSEPTPQYAAPLLVSSSLIGFGPTGQPPATNQPFASNPYGPNGSNVDRGPWPWELP